MRWGGKLLCGFLAVIATATATPSHSGNPVFVSETVAACQASVDASGLPEKLSKIGWVHTLPADLDDRAIAAYAATFFQEHISFGEVPDQRIVSSWERSIKNARGARRLIQSADAHIRTNWFVSDQTGSLLRVKSRSYKAYADVQCLIALKPEDSAFTFQKLVAVSQKDSLELPLVYHLRSRNTKAGEIKRSLNGRIINTERVSALLGQEFDVASVYFTMTAYKAGSSE